MSYFVVGRNSLSNAVAIICVFAIAYWSGWRIDGIDRDNYVNMYLGVLSSEDLAQKFFYAKDALFLLLVTGFSYFTDNAKPAFLILCFLSLLIKYFAVMKMDRRYTLSFILCYAVFLSPGLEFAAMRSGLAIGFLMLAIAYINKPLRFLIFSTLAIASHLSMVLVVILCYRPVKEFFVKHQVIGFLAITIIIYFFGKFFIEIFPHGADYEENKGTLMAYFLPTSTLMISVLVFYRFDKIAFIKSNDSMYQFIIATRPVIFGLIAISFGISSVVVTAATRYLEVSWVLLLLVTLVLYRKSYVSMLGGLLFFAFLSYLNIIRSTWLGVFFPELV